MFGRPGLKYNKLNDSLESYPPRWKKEIDLGLPSGVTISDLIQENESAALVEQIYRLALQSNHINEYLKRINHVKAPNECKNVIENQVTKLKAMQAILWNTMISMAIGSVSIDETAFQTILDKKTDDTIALLEFEKIASAIKSDSNSEWAKELEKIIGGSVNSAPEATVTAQPVAVNFQTPSTSVSVHPPHKPSQTKTQPQSIDY